MAELKRPTDCNLPSRPLLGAHMSISGGVTQALVRGHAGGCECIQIFTKNHRMWASKPYPKQEIETFRKTQPELGIRTVLAHDSYLVNMGAGEGDLRKKSIAGIIDEIERCEQLGVPLLVAHPGAHVGAGEAAGIANIAAAINEVHLACPGYQVKIALEITAGQGSNLGYKFEQMGRIIDGVNDNGRLRVCFDTEHAFAAGYDLRTEEGYDATFTELDQHVGIELLAAFHVNDSAKPLSSRVDRHEHIGKGHLGIEVFRRLVNDPRFAGLPMCLETDPGEDSKDILADLKLLFSLLDKPMNNQ